MAWLGKLGASIAIFFTSLTGYFGVHREASPVPTPASQQAVTTVEPSSQKSASVASSTEPILSNWKTYIDGTYDFSFNYPSQWILKPVLSKEPLPMDLIGPDGQDISISTGLRNTSNSYEDTFPKYITAQAPEDYSWPTDPTNLSFEKIIDDATTTGYVSQWQFQSGGGELDKNTVRNTINLIRADFESENLPEEVNQYGSFKTVVSLHSDNTDAATFKSIAATFHFN